MAVDEEESLSPTEQALRDVAMVDDASIPFRGPNGLTRRARRFAVKVIQRYEEACRKAMPEDLVEWVARSIHRTSFHPEENHRRMEELWEEDKERMFRKAKAAISAYKAFMESQDA